MGNIDLPTAVAIAGAAVDGHVLRELRDRGFTGLRPRHGYVVQRLVFGPDTASSMARDLGVPQHVVASIVRELVALGYVEHVTADLDKRGRPVALTARGHDAVRATTAAWSRLDHRLRDAVGASRAESAVEALMALMRMLDVPVDDRKVRLPDDRS